MKIQGGSAATTAGAPTRASGQGAAAFSPEPSAASMQGAAPAGPSGSLGPIASLGALLALQETLGPLERRRRAVKRAGLLLDGLDSVKLSLLEGGAAGASLASLKSAVDEHRAETDDPTLEGLLDEIDVRAAVELAKQEMTRSPGVQTV